MAVVVTVEADMGAADTEVAASTAADTEVAAFMVVEAVVLVAADTATVAVEVSVAADEVMVVHAATVAVPFRGAA
jgi:hypothetical protein